MRCEKTANPKSESFSLNSLFGTQSENLISGYSTNPNICRILHSMKFFSVLRVNTSSSWTNCYISAGEMSFILALSGWSPHEILSNPSQAVVFLIAVSRIFVVNFCVVVFTENYLFVLPCSQHFINSLLYFCIHLVHFLLVREPTC